MERYAPSESMVNELLIQVRDFVGDKGYFWLGACAIYPELRWPLTLYFGYQLELLTEEEEKKKERLVKLTRLPWFRYGYMPNWLRKRLVWDLSLEDDKAVREKLQGLLLNAQERPISDFKLKVVVKFPDLIKRLLSIWSKSKVNPLQDYVFLSFIKDRLAVKATKSIREFVKPSNLLHLPNYTTVGLFVIFLVVIGVSHDKLQFEPEGWNRVEKPPKIVEQKIKVFQDRLKDDGLGPKMVWISAGKFRMGDIQGVGFDSEKPVHWVEINYQFAMGQYEVTVSEFRIFVNSTGYKTEAEKKGKCYGLSLISNDSGINWQMPRFPQQDNQPVVCVSWNDVNAYTKWLSKQTGKQYRLPSEAEWEYVARAGTETKYWWGNEIGKNKANCILDFCDDNFEYTAPVGSFTANQFGLYNTVGNVWEWCADGWHDNYENAPTDGSIWEKNNKMNNHLL